MTEAMQEFFRSCPQEILLSYRRKYLDGDPSLDTPDKMVAELVGKFGTKKESRKALKRLTGRHHLALIALMQAGGVAGGSWLLQEMVLAHGGREDAWAEILHQLGRQLLVFGNSHQAPPLFYVLPRPLLGAFSQHFTRKMGLPVSDADDIRLSKDTNYNFPVGYSLASVLTYLAQEQVRVTQKGEVFKKNQEEAVEFFGSLWGQADADKVMAWHMELLELLGLVRVEDGQLLPDDDEVEEWLALDPRDRRDLFMAAFERRAPLLPWLLEHLRRMPEGAWVPVDAINTLYRRRYMGSVFRKRFVLKTYYLPPSGFYNPTPPLEFMQIAGLIERGIGAAGPMARLSTIGREFLAGHPLGEAPSGEAFQFHLQPNFEVLAPAGLPLQQLYGLGQMCTFVSCDRVNRYLLTKETVLGAMDTGWRRSELLRFLRHGTAHGVPQNVDSTVDEWMADHGEVEFHDAMVVTVHADRDDALREAIDVVTPRYRRMAPGVYATPRTARARLLEVLAERGLHPAPWVREYRQPADGSTAMERLRRRLDEGGEDTGLSDADEDDLDFPARQLVVLQPPHVVEGASDDSMEVFTALNGDGRPIAGLGHDLGRKPGAAGSGDLLKLSPSKTLDLVRAAINRGHDIEILYRQSGEGGNLALTRVTPSKVTTQGGVSTFDGRDHLRRRDATFVVKRVQGIRLARGA